MIDAKGGKMIRKRVLVTGASKGIGKAIAWHLSGQSGYEVIGTSRSPEKYPFLEKEGGYSLLKLDVTDSASVQNLADQVLSKGPLYCLINSAGFGVFGPVQDTPEEDARRQFEVNFWGADRMIRAFLPAMINQGQGTIINISSLAAEASLPYQAYYSAAKAALTSWSLALRSEVKPLGVKVVVVEPGDIQTEFDASRVLCPFISEVQEERCLHVLEAQRRGEKNGGDPMRIARLAQRIIEAKNPLPVYRIGPSAFLVTLGRLLPEIWFCRAIELAYNIS